MQEGEAILFSTKGKRFFVISLIFLVIIYSVLSNPQVTNAQLILYLININNEDPSMLVGTSETVRMFSTCLCSKNEDNKGNDDADLKVLNGLLVLLMVMEIFIFLRKVMLNFL